nr:hypothetical protein B0A51_01975 [Rachicladosporium sp. CCFEE 5018]
MAAAEARTNLMQAQCRRDRPAVPTSLVINESGSQASAMLGHTEISLVLDDTCNVARHNPRPGAFSTQSVPNASPAQYQYEELRNEDDIRLLRFRKRRAGGIASSLHRFQLSSPDRPVYRALSYTWDIEQARFELEMPQGSVLRVRKNLWDALVSMGDTATEAWVWCDAVCINQSSDIERNHQVKLMADIYRNANIVEAWLG